jgi:voltage-dependent potassium channel beta subunit
MAEMTYRRLGASGVKVSTLSFGSWVTFDAQMDLDRSLACMDAAYQAGVNFFDNAEMYAGGEAERLMGAAFRELGWDRRSYLVTSKYFWGIHDRVNMKNTLNRKYLFDAVEGSLERFGLDFLDVIYCHRPDPHTPLKETVRAMSDLIDRGLALYWGTSEWSADEIRAAWLIAEKYGWHEPITEQPQYNLVHRDRVENEYARLYGDIGLGLTTWSPLAYGLLTGKYRDGIPEGTRASIARYTWMREHFTNEKYQEPLAKFEAIATRLGASMAQLAIAWCAANPNVSTVITGASRPEQVVENLAAIEVLDAIDEDVFAEIAAVFS